MHELSIVASLFEILEDRAREEKAKRIVLVKLSTGRLSGVVPEFLETAFDLYKKDTIAEHASLEIEVVPVRVRCRDCQAEAETDDYVFVCSACGSAHIEIVAGTDLLLDKIELEV
ncbi:MAG: hydrogenase maturation nickel metallochaperone HypA [Acidobacteriota bacterium]